MRNIKRLFHLYQIHRLRKKLMADFTVLNANIANLKTDAEALIAKLAAENATVQTGIDAAAAAVAAVDTEVKANLP